MDYHETQLIILEEKPSNDSRPSDDSERPVIYLGAEPLIYFATDTRSAARSFNFHEHRDSNLGFRVLRIAAADE